MLGHLCFQSAFCVTHIILIVVKGKVAGNLEGTSGLPSPCKKKDIRQNMCGADDLKWKPYQSLSVLILFPGSDSLQEKSPELPHGCYTGTFPQVALGRTDAIVQLTVSPLPWTPTPTSPPWAILSPPLHTLSVVSYA